MSRCTCSSLALELFIKDLAGLNIRRSLRPLPRTSIRQHPHQRTFGTRHALYRPQAVVAERVGVDDGFIPFEFERNVNEDRRDGKGIEAQGKREVGSDDGREVDAEWHAEIQITGEWPHRTSGVRAERDVGEEGAEASASAESVVVDEGTGAQDGAVAAEPFTMDAPTRESAEEAAAHSEATSAPAVRVKSRAENRLERKQRRVQAGLWGIQRSTRQREAFERAEVEEDADALLERIGRESEELETELYSKEDSRILKENRRKKRMTGEKADGVGDFVVEGKWKQAATTTLRTTGTRDGKKSSQARISPSLEESRIREEPKRAANATPKMKEPKDDPNAKRHQAETSAPKPKQEPWQIQKAALTTKFGDAGWNPNKKLSPDTMSGIRALHASDPAAYTTRTLSEHFEVSPEAIRRILRSKWRPSEAEAEDRRVRWEKRGVRKWGDMAQKGIRPPKKWREMGVGWERKSRSATPRSRGLGERRVQGREAGMEEGVGMLNGIHGEVEARLD